jgi:hypothetical protein
MSEPSSLGPFTRVVAAVAALLAMSAFVMTKWVGFLQPPPPLYHYASFPEPSQNSDFWLPMVSLCTGVICAVVLLFLPWKKNRTKFKIGLTILTVLAVLVFVVLATVYEYQRSKWTFDYNGETVLIGDQYTPAGKGDPRDSRPDWFGDFGANSRDVWTEAGLWRCQLRLGSLFLATSVVGGISFSLAAWIVALFAAESKQPSERQPHGQRPQDQETGRQISRPRTRRKQR